MSLQAERLYYEDSYLTEFSSVVIEVKEQNGEVWVRFQGSAFYPTSGGQPHDTGYLQVAGREQEASTDQVSGADHVAVTAVEVEGDHVWHRVSAPVAVGQAVTGRIDWARRFDFMQQHNGQHILSACFEQMLGANTTSFHMGDAYSSIDLDVASLSDEQLRDVVWEANRWIWRDVPIRARFVTEAELAQMHLRKAPSVTENIRIVTIEGLEDNACGGTHPSSTGQVGQILVTKTERMRGGVRVMFVCGERALAAGKEAVDLVRGIATDLSVGPTDLADTVQSLQNQVKEAKRSYDEVRSRYASLLARDFAENQTKVVGGTRVLLATLPDPDEVADLKRLALSSAEWLEAEHPGEPQLVVFAGEVGGRTHLVAQATEGAVVGADALVKVVLPALDGKGGGNAKAAQGSAPATSQQVVDLVESVLAERSSASC